MFTQTMNWLSAPRASAVFFVLALPTLARADVPTPKFTYGNKEEEEKKAAQWEATVQAGIGTATGNSRALSLSLNAMTVRRSGDDKLSAEIAGAFARTRIFVAAEQNGIAGLGPGEIREVTQTTTQAWSMLGRYDRFVAERDALYLSGSVFADEPAGKKLLAGGQVGYRRTLFQVVEPPAPLPVPNGSAPPWAPDRITPPWTPDSLAPSAPPHPSMSPQQELILELGYDLTHQAYVSADPSIMIHSGRIFFGYHANWQPTLAGDASVELLTNLNAGMTPTRPVRSLQWNRVTAMLGTTVRISENGNVGLRFSAHYDSVPAPRPPPADSSYEPGFVPLADRLDTKTELVLMWRLF